MALHFKKAIDLATELNRDTTHDEFYEGKNFMVKINGTTNYAEILVLDKGKQVQTLTPDMVNKFLEKYTPLWKMSQKVLTKKGR